MRGHVRWLTVLTVVLAVMVAIRAQAAAWPGLHVRPDLVRVLVREGLLRQFPKPSDGDYSFLRLGEIRAGGRCYRLYYARWDQVMVGPHGRLIHAWEQTPAQSQGYTLHASYHVMVFSCSQRYLGEYAFESESGVPKITGKSVIFPTPFDGNDRTILFTDDGPPKIVVVGGDRAWFETNTDWAKLFVLPNAERADIPTMEFQSWYVGPIRVGAACYRVIYYEYLGGRGTDPRILVFTCSRRYVGQYENVPDVPIRTSAQAIVFCASALPCAPSKGHTIEFTTSGPPDDVQVEGKDLIFAKYLTQKR